MAHSVGSILSLVKLAISYIAPIFIVTSPVTSYADQIWNIHRTRSSAGFSLDIPLIMLVACILKCFYWLGARYDLLLLIQALVMTLVQVLLLHVMLLHRPPFGAQHRLNKPFAGASEGDSYVSRPYNFWRWRSRRPYWQFLASLAATLAALQYLVGQQPTYITLQGYVALGVEALLPIPQILQNHNAQSCKGFRLSVLANWLLGDVFKLTYFFLSDADVPLAFKLCGVFQAACDCVLGLQYWMYGEGEVRGDGGLKVPRVA